MSRQAAQRSEVTPATRGTLTLSPVALEHFDEYVIVAKLGQGGMAEVFLALSQGPSGFRKLLVIKRLHAHLNDDQEHVAMFLQEARLAARLHHSNVVQTNKVGCYLGQHFLAMEYLDGQPLNRVLHRLRAKTTPMVPEVAARIISDALDGLHYAHEARDYEGTPLEIVHRDVSPHNIFVTYDGQVKLLDFGIAKGRAAESNTRMGLIKGKLSYIAPEQARSQVVDRRADLWSMGVTLWECLAGERLFQGPDDVATLRAAMLDDIPLLSEVNSHVPEELAQILQRALQRDPDKRFATALAFKEELDAWLVSCTTTSSRTLVSVSLQALFAEKREERAEVLRSCLAHVSLHAQVDPPRAPPPAMWSGSDMQPPPVLSRPSMAIVQQRRPKLAAILGVALIAAVLAFYDAFGALREGGEGGETGRTALDVASNSVGQAAAAAEIPQGRATPLAELSTERADAPAPKGARTPDDYRDHDTYADEMQSRRIGPLPTLAPAAQANGRLNTKRKTYPLRVVPATEDASEQPVEARADAVPPPNPQVNALPGKLARLALDSTPYAIVSLNGRRLGITPLEVELPATTHTLLLRNPEQDLETTYQITLAAGESTRRHIALD